MTRTLPKPDGLAVLAGCVVAVLVVAMPDAAGLDTMAACLVLALTCWIAAQDLATYTIPDGPVVAIALIGAILRFVDPWGGGVQALGAAALDAILCGGAMLAVREGYFRLKGSDGLGFGDVKLSAACACLVGTLGFSHALLGASIAGLAVAIVVMRRTAGTRIDRLPFGALLAPACWIVWVLAP
ncbi:prepilin peptidase [Ensifer soli]|uniref:prepilin peptidase n=1 Tax=Ciceribacter sp. sgz301302 TaxID=3342379 RepID=UPI0035BA4AB6